MVTQNRDLGRWPMLRLLVLQRFLFITAPSSSNNSPDLPLPNFLDARFLNTLLSNYSLSTQSPSTHAPSRILFLRHNCDIPFLYSCVISTHSTPQAHPPRSYSQPRSSRHVPDDSPYLSSPGGGLHLRISEKPWWFPFFTMTLAARYINSLPMCPNFRSAQPIRRAR